jgi:hypothetical protein
MGQIVVEEFAACVVGRATVAKYVTRTGELPHNGHTVEKTGIAACTHYGHYAGSSTAYGTAGTQHICFNVHITSAETLLQKSLHTFGLLLVATAGAVEMDFELRIVNCELLSHGGTGIEHLFVGAEMRIEPFGNYLGTSSYRCPGCLC